MTRSICRIIAFLFLLGPLTLQADIKLPKIFSDNMVLQRDAKINVWGTADANEELEISIGENAIKTTADDAGNWKVQVPAPPAGGPYELKITGAASQVVFTNVAVGEVWLCSGQSNMEWKLIDGLIGKSDEEKEAFIGTIADTRLRLFTVSRSAQDQPAKDFSNGSPWQECSPQTVRDFSAVAYFFAKYLRENERLADMPIGLINVTWGGTRCEAWTSREGLDSQVKLAPLLKHWDENTEATGPNRPGVLYNGMVAPLVPFSMRGVLWYQGEANVGRGEQYETLFPTMIRDWRKHFEQGDLPFYFVQLAPYRYGQQDPKALPEVWDAQRKTLSVVNTGMVVTLDIGNVNDIHPRNKEEVGRRLALIARSRTYGESNLEYSGPIFERHEIEGTAIRCYFKFNQGLESAVDELQGFTICGDDQNFVPAKAIIDGETVVVWCDDLTEPKAVRFSWDDSSAAYLYNSSGLPASPFRTDNFELLSKDRHYRP